MSFSTAFLRPESVWEILDSVQMNRALLSYPAPKLKGAVDIGKLDLLRLSTGCFLNDQIIDFYLKYLYDKGPTLLSPRQLEDFGDRWSESERSRFYFFNQFFYSKLSEGLRGGGLGEKDKAVEVLKSTRPQLEAKARYTLPYPYHSICSTIHRYPFYNTNESLCTQHTPD